jgi:membrane fusion protein, multidrug efflux system
MVLLGDKQRRKRVLRVRWRVALRLLVATLARWRCSIVLAIVAVALAGCGSRNAYVAPPPPRVVVAQPLQQPVTLYVDLTGNTAPFRTANLVARVQGYLESIDYQDGVAVTKGTQLFGIERGTYQATLNQTKAQSGKDQSVLEQATVNLTRYQTLVLQNSIARQQAEDQAFVVQQDKASVELDQANVDTAAINLGYTRVLAPFDGIVTNHQVDIGNLVGTSGATTLATIIQVDKLYVNFTVSEPQFLAMRKSVVGMGRPLESGIPIEFGLANEEGYPHTGHLDYVSPQVDASSGTVSMRATFENKDNAVVPGLFVRVRVPIEHQDSALLTRDAAIGTSQEGSYVLVVGADDVVARKVIKTGQRQGQLRIIESGLDPDDWVVTEGVQRAFPGAKVQPQRSELKSVSADAAGGVKTSVVGPKSD